MFDLMKNKSRLICDEILFGHISYFVLQLYVHLHNYFII